MPFQAIPRRLKLWRGQRRSKLFGIPAQIVPPAVFPWTQDGSEDFFAEEPGSTPGTLRIDPDAAPSELIAIDYSRTHWERQLLAAPTDCEPLLDSGSVTWLDVQGLGSEEVLRQ
ncbi:MAG: hypothetical protein VKL01_07550, partial [Limnothrix sp.]|nr:hypothetical protein [Limnothrix sp.]